MTPAEHNKWLGIAHLAYAGLQVVGIGALWIMMWLLLTGRLDEGEPAATNPPPLFFLVIMVFGSMVATALTIPIIVAAYAFLKRRPSAKTAGLIGGVVAGMNFPFGTALGVYTFWFLLSNAGKEIYEGGGSNLPAPPPPPTAWH